MSNVRNESNTIKKFMSSADFVRGYNEFHEGKPLDPDALYHRKVKCQDVYERGRQFACVYSEPLKNGKKLRFDAILNFSNALVTGAILSA